MQSSDYNSGGGSSLGGGGGSSTPTSNAQTYRTIIRNRDNGTQKTIESGDSPYYNLAFTFEANTQPVTPPTDGTTISIKADVYKSNAIKYITEFESGLIYGNENITTTSKWIKFERQSNGEQYKSVVSISDKNYTNQDVQINLGGGTVNVNVLATKNDVAPSPSAPTLSVGNQFTWNINDSNPLSISYSSNNADYVELSLGNIKRQISSNGILNLSRNELNRIGNHTLYLQSVSNRGGSSSVQTISINVIEKSYLPGPDITNI